MPFVIPVPSQASSYALFLKIAECIDEEAKNWPQSTGMKCVAVGYWEGTHRKQAAKKGATKKKQASARKATGKRKTGIAKNVKGKASSQKRSPPAKRKKTPIGSK